MLACDDNADCPTGNVCCYANVDFLSVSSACVPDCTQVQVGIHSWVYQLCHEDCECAAFGGVCRQQLLGEQWACCVPNGKPCVANWLSPLSDETGGCCSNCGTDGICE